MNFALVAAPNASNDKCRPVRIGSQKSYCPLLKMGAERAARLLKPLGNPPPNSIKFFATREVLELAKDRTWLAKITHAVNQHWQRKNSQKKGRPAKDSPGGPVAG